MGEISKGIAKLAESAIKVLPTFEPFQLKRIGKAKQEIFESACKSLEENIHLPTKYENGEFTIDTTDVKAMITRSENLDKLDRLRKQNNFEQVLEKTEDLLVNDNDVNDEPLDPDFFFKVRDCSGEVSNEEMQNWWAKLIAGEVKKPGSFSRRTLETLKNLSEEEARFFEKICKIAPVFNGERTLLHDEEFLKLGDIDINQLYQMQDTQLLDLFTVILTPSFNFDEPSILIIDENYVIKTSKDGELKIPKITFTQQGKELARLITAPIELNTVIQFAITVDCNNENIDLSLHEIETYDKVAGTITYNDENLLMCTCSTNEKP
ncbi:MAG: DUF2806 domain-containing protein [Eubacteriales bacterium]